MVNRSRTFLCYIQKSIKTLPNTSRNIKIPKKFAPNINTPIINHRFLSIFPSPFLSFSISSLLHSFESNARNPSARFSYRIRASMASADLEKKAKEAFIDDHFELAADLYSQAISLSPNSADLFVDRAQANIKLQNFTGKGFRALIAEGCLLYLGIRLLFCYWSSVMR